MFEVTRLSAGAGDLRSILFAPGEDTILEAGEEGDKRDSASAGSGNASNRKETNLADSSLEGYVNKSAEIFVATPIDPIFILLPLMDRSWAILRKQSGEGLFRPFDDILDEQLDDDRHLRYVLTHPTFRPTLLRAMSQICDSVDAGDEQMYRLNALKLYEYILAKTKRVVENGLPDSLEDRFVARSLQVPMLSVKRDKTTVSFVAEETDVASERLTPDLVESQSSAASTIASVALSETSSVTSIGTVDHTPSPGLVHLQRLRTAMSFITASYLDSTLSAKLAEISCQSKAAPDFGPLDEHLRQLAKLRAEALATRSLSDFSKKRNLDDDAAAEERVEKRRKQEEEDKKKKGQESRGVRDLKKVNVSGMKKMNDFFAKKAPTANSKS